MRRRREGGGEKWVETTITTFTEDRYATRNRLCFVEGGFRRRAVVVSSPPQYYAEVRVGFLRFRRARFRLRPPLHAAVGSTTLGQPPAIAEDHPLP